MTSLPARRFAALLALLGLVACALDAPVVDDVLPANPGLAEAHVDDGTLSLAERGERLQAEVDQLSSEALGRARQYPDDVSAALEATRRLFQSADVRMQRSLVADFAERRTADIDDLLTAEELPPEVQREILSLCTAGLEQAERGLESNAADPLAQLHVALHLSLIAWVNGPLRSMFAGYGSRLSSAIDKVVAIDPGFDHASPLRLQGRFLSQAPWPYGDAGKARESLERAVELASVPVNHLFLGDVLFAAEESEAAAEQWQRALEATDDESTRFSGPFHRELARLRLAALPRR